MSTLAYAYESGYQDGLKAADTEKAALERRIDELCAEVERLRNQLRDQQDTAGHNFVRNAREYKRVCDENAKLRKILSSYWKAVHSPVTTNVPRDYLKEMRELGMEVD